MRAHPVSDDAGVGLIEIVIAMFVLFILAVAILPALVGATRTSVTNKELVAATNLANQQIAAVRALYPDDSEGSSCLGLQSPNFPQIVADTATGLTAETTIDTTDCPILGSSNPGTAIVEVSVGSGTEPSLVSLTTKIVVAAP